MSLSNEYNTSARSVSNRAARRRARAIFAGVVVLILLLAAGITALLERGNTKEEGLALPEKSGTAANILAPIPMQGGGSAAKYGPVHQVVGQYTLIKEGVTTIRQPACGQVSLDYFADAAFLGDSLTEGFSDYNINLGGALVCGYIGAGPNGIVNKTTQNHIERGQEVPLDVLAENMPKKVYVLLGTNTLTAAGSEESFLAYYGKMIDMLYETLGQDVILYLQSVPPVTEGTAANGKEGLASDLLANVNERLAFLAEEKGCVYLDLWEVFADENNNLNETLAAPDGVHLSAGDGYTTWVNYLRTHTLYASDNPWTPGSDFAA